MTLGKTAAKWLASAAITIGMASTVTASNAQNFNLNSFTYQIGGATSTTSKWVGELFGIPVVTFFNGSNTNQSFGTLPLVFTQAGNNLTATFYLPEAQNVPYSAGNPQLYPLTYAGTINSNTGAFTLTKALGSPTEYNEVGSGNLSILGLSTAEWVYQTYSSGTLTLSGTATHVGGSRTTALSTLSLSDNSTIPATVQASTSSADPTAALSISSSSGSLISVGGFGIVTINVANTVTWNVSAQNVVTPGPEALAVFAPGLGLGLAAIRRRSRGKSA